MPALRLVLMPHGPPGPELKASCMDIIRRSGGDLRRIIDSPTTTPEIFAKHIARMKALSLGAAPLVVLTRTSPLALALTGTRRTLEKFVPALKNAAWLVFYDRADDPFFEAEAREIGTLEPRTEYSALWRSSTRQHYLIIARGDHLDLGDQVQELLSLPPGDPEREGWP